MQQMREIRFGESVERPVPVLATFSLTSSDIQALRALVDSGSNSPPCSTFALSCGYVWVCLVKARGQVGDKLVYFSFSADCRIRLKPAVPDTYFGNCILSVFAEAVGSDLAREDGVVIATMAIAKAVQGLENGGALKGAESLIPTFAALDGERVVILAGSPRFRVYEMDFGWGRPKKTEVVSIERTEGVYIGDSREEDGGIEFGLVMPKSEMGVFASFFQEGLNCQQ